MEKSIHHGVDYSVAFDTEALVAIMKSDRYTPCASLHPSGNSILMHYSRHDVTYNLPLSTAITLLSRCRPVLGARAKELLEHMEKHAVEPTYASNRSLACFLSKQRSVVFDHIMLHGLTTPSHWSFETQLYVCIFRCIGVDLTKHKVKAVRTPMGGAVSRWMKIVRYKVETEIAMGCMTTEANTAQVEELRNLLRRFISEKGRTKVCEFSSVAEYVVKCLKVGDIEPVECTRSPAHDNMNNVRGVLSFFTQPLLVHNQCIAPTQTIKSCRSTYYSPSSLPVGLTSVLRDFVDTKIPAWIRDIHEKVHTTPLSKETLIANISNDFVWYDHFPVSLRGTNPLAGHDLITRTDNPGPRRLHLSVAIQEPKYRPISSAHTQECYGYSYSITPLSWMGCRSMDQYPEIARIGYEAWTAVRAHLDPVSQQCPPTACNILHYFGAFGAFIRPHQDNCPNMQLPDYKWNSQLLGSSVLVVNLFDSQMMKLSDVETKREVGSFLTEHMSIYVLSAFDDIRYRHTTTFLGTKGANESKVRISLVYRWLGRRTKAFCGDYNGELRWCEYHPNPNAKVKAKFPRCREHQKGFRHGTQRWKKFKTTESV